MSQELLKAWVHNVLQNPIDDHQLAHAEATKELLEENARYREALEFYAWTCEPTKIQRSDNSGTLVMVEDKEKALACYNEDLFLFGKRAREALKGE